MTVGITELPPEGMQLGGVALAGDADRGTKTTEGLSLLFTTAGITVQGPQPQIERLLVWSGLDTATCREKIALNDGRSAAVMELTSGGQSIRFLLPTETVTPGQAAYLDQALPAWLARYKGSSGTPAPPAPGAPTQPGPGVAPAAAAATGAVAGAAAATAAGVAANGVADASPAPAAAAAPGMAAPAAAFTPAPPTGLSAPPPPPPPTASAPPPPPPAGAVAAPAPGGPGAPAAPTASAPPPPPPPAPAVSGPEAGALPSPGQTFLPPAASAPPPPPPPAVGQPGAQIGGWEGLTTPAPAGEPPVGWDGQPTGQVPAGDVLPPPKKTRSWRKGRQEAPAAPAELGQFGVPSGPPTEPVPLAPGVLPPPPGQFQAPGGPDQPVVWKPPVDPVTGEPVWDSAYGVGAAVTAPPTEEATKSKRSFSLKRGAKAGAVGAAAGVGAAAVVEGSAPAPPGTSPVGPWPSGALGDPAAAGAWSTAPDAGPADPFAVAPLGPEGGAFPPASDVAPSGSSAKGGRNNRTAVLLLVILLVVVVAGGAIYYVKKHNNSSTPSATPTTAAGGVSADVALAGSINLRLGDLPAGWTRAAVAAEAERPPAAPPAAQAKAVQAMASCLGQPATVASGLFGGGALPGQQTAVRSPTFASGADPNIQMFSSTAVLGTAAEAEAAASAFAAPTFGTCYAQFQSATIAATVPGATASVQTVTLTAPAGVKSYGYVTTFTIPGQGTEVVGEAYMLGNTTVTRLQPSTNGPAIPGGAFTPAYNAVVARVAQAATR